MTSASPLQAHRESRWVCCSCAVGLILVLLSTSGCLRVSRDAAALRDSVMEAAQARWEEKVEVGVGALTLGVARLGLSYADLPPEAEMALQSIRGADVGVYDILQSNASTRPGMILEAGDRVMAGRGWDRVVGVIKDGQVVAVYIPRDASTERDIRLCVAVLDKRQLVVVAAKSDLGPVLALALQRPELKSHGNWAL